MDELLTAIDTSIGIMKKLKTLNDKVKDADFRMLLADLSIELANSKSSVADLLNENRILKEKIKEMETAASKVDKLIFRNNAYYSENGEGPFCPACYDSKNKKIRLVDNLRDFVSISGKYKCPVCGAHIKG